MKENNKPVLVYATFESSEEAERICGPLVDGHLAACINILPDMTSLYIWQGKRETSQEVVALIKTMRSRADEVIAHIQKHHSYDNPAVLVLPTEGGSRAFLSWIAARSEGSERAK